ncbi:hypothetical protein PIB30_039162 [Stylosanthes scabra]|uniref:Uncharacterized protein n=1 Tax=Stylosanthes scabra TaxID=79078 RepID=A0ABU6WEC9_9FABA|nr:hypothetical protein [Stylosanthes scabra]
MGDLTHYLVLSLVTMPIYYDYHGDSKDSSISSWDHIQIRLKCLLPTYEPILCDSTVVSSFLSDQKQMQIGTDFEHTYGRIIATMNEFIQEEEVDPEIQTHLQINKTRYAAMEQPHQALENKKIKIRNP